MSAPLLLSSSFSVSEPDVEAFAVAAVSTFDSALVVSSSSTSISTLVLLLPYVSSSALNMGSRFSIVMMTSATLRRIVDSSANSNLDSFVKFSLSVLSPSSLYARRVI